MASRSDIQAGAAYVRLYAKDSELIKGLKKFQGQLKTLASGLKQFGEEVGKIGRAITGVGLIIGGTLAAGIAKVVAKRPELAEVAAAFNSVRAAVEELFVQIAQALAPSLIEISKNITVVIRGIADFVAKNRELIVDFAKAVVIVTGVGIAIVAMGKAFALAGALISVANTAITVSTAIATTAVGALNFAIGLLFTPVGLIVGAVAGLGIGVLKAAGAFDGAGKQISSSVKAMAATTVTAFGGVKDALMSGDLAGAAKIAWIGIRTVWAQGVDMVMSIWDQFITTLHRGWVSINRIITEMLLGTFGFITRQVQNIIRILNKIPGVEIGANVEFDSATAIQNAREAAGASIQEREQMQLARKRDREALITGLSKELADAIDQSRQKAANDLAAVPAAGEQTGLPPGVSPGDLTKEQILASRTPVLPDSRTLGDSGSFGTFFAGGIGQALGIGSPMQKVPEKLDKLGATNKAMLDELKRIKLEFTA